MRPIDQHAFDKIIEAGIGRPATKRVAALKRTQRVVSSRSKAEVGGTSHEVALDLATAEAKAEWPSAKIFRAPTGQHFSLIVRQPNSENHHITVKFTEELEPLVRLSDGEIAYAKAHAAAYSLWVFYALDPGAGTAMLIKRKGRITDDDIDLRSAVHGGRLKNTTRGKKVGPTSG
ncbi:hypothetical protein PT015_21750 [Candidatus Mycobacterium wuenschmannii]|uniref:Uncharacterized protein n=1 Tax=Candidatus Mycobacterium wuenschmannii TaxID=3027808 RepID=A0ABY8VUY2_9MYCO|nr:hypothetical protein [Candidatus Mycobacterium wuenschmannii]WIM87433.1 hypothetical protein PT015_21750 [Candidatus Mycobacterium wuenschmannii]